MTPNVKRGTVTIFEGPDGSGKSTAAQEYARLNAARYIHHGPYKEVGDGLARMFLESMLPALLGYQDVVLDRCWLSEPIYGRAFRKGQDRVGLARSRVLERAALSCGAVIVNCRPSWETCRDTFLSRRDTEYLENEAQLRAVYDEYDTFKSDLSEVEFDYTAKRDEPQSLVLHQLHRDLQRLRSPTHETATPTSGAYKPRVIIVGDEFGERKNNDALLQLPFGSFSGAGCSLWLAEQLELGGISERWLGWINSVDVPESIKNNERGSPVIALGEDAAKRLTKRGLKVFHTVPHPQYWKRFRNNQPYPLLAAVHAALKESTP